jgi:hypothetical protein
VCVRPPLISNVSGPRAMDTQQIGTPVPYDRRLLSSGIKRNAVLELWEMRRHGTDGYGDADYVSVYGLRPADWYAKGIRLLGRTAVETLSPAPAIRCTGSHRRQGPRP